MDRFEWLKCQSWLLPAFSSPATDAAAPSAAVDWFFEGFASFYTCPLPHQHDEALSENAAHLFFSVQPSSTLDPAQLDLKIGIIRDVSRCVMRDVIFSFENTGSFYSLDFKQVLSVIRWRQEQGCPICKESGCISAIDERVNNCACQVLPSYVTVRLKHVSMIIYSRNESSPQIVGVMDTLWKAFEDKRPPDYHGTEKIGSTPCASEAPSCLSTVLGSSKRTLQQFLTKLDCMTECAVGAVDVCNADLPSMSRMLHVLMQHAAEHREYKIQSKSLECELQSIFKNLEAL